MNCIQCSTPTTNPNFCSRSCSNSYNNRLYPKRKKRERMCKKCPTVVQGRRTVCDLCNPFIIDWDTVTLADLKKARAYQVHSRLRELARRWYIKSGRPMSCVVCSYTTHVEVCHIVDIQWFSNTAAVTRVNAPSNLVPLCPNHHWEFDNDKL